jgi:hypothetical protein
MFDKLPTESQAKTVAEDLVHDEEGWNSEEGLTGQEYLVSECHF